MTDRIENTILRNVLFNQNFSRQVIPFLKSEYFKERTDSIIIDGILDYAAKFNNIPTTEAIIIELSDSNDITEQEYTECCELVSYLKDTVDAAEQPDIEWLMSTTEKFCQDAAIYNAVSKSIRIINGDDTTTPKTAIPELLSDAISVCFDTHIGHDYLEDVDERFEFYHRTDERIPFDLAYFNKMTKGGLPRKSLSIILGGTNVGKSLVMCHFASANLMAGKNVLYVTAEMAEERISERIDANLLNIALDDLESTPREIYMEKFSNRVQKRASGKLIVKEFPTASAHSGHIRHLLRELKLKKKFVPDIIYLDYLNIFASSRMKMGGSINTNTFVKSIAEEMRGLAVEFDVPIVSATQTNRTGFTNSDPGMEDTAESFGLPQTADFMVAIVSTEELDEMGQYMVKQLKNRWADKRGLFRKFVVGVDKPHMRLYDLDESAQQASLGASMGRGKSSQEDAPVADNGAFGEDWRGRRKPVGSTEGFNF